MTMRITALLLLAISASCGWSAASRAGEPQKGVAVYNACPCGVAGYGVGYGGHHGGLLAPGSHGGHHVVGHLYHRHLATKHAGQPCIDPYMKADWIAANRAATQSWHAGYYHTAWGAPVALVVPPTARMHTRWGWGVSQTTMSPLYPQFERPYPGPFGPNEAMAGMSGTPLLPTPRWPSHTDQFGVYPVRGPW